MIQVLKRDGSVEGFDARKLTAAIWRSMRGASRTFEHACRLAEAVELYLRRRDVRCISSTALFEMTLKVLRCVGPLRAADAAEKFRQLRDALRRQLRIRHEKGRITYWDKAWACEFARASWGVSPQTARILAGKIEIELFALNDPVVPRQKVLDMLNRMMAEYGLADAVPARL